MLDDAPEFLALVFASLSEAVAGEIDDVESSVVDSEVVDKKSLTGLLRGFGKAFAAGEHIYERGFANVGSADKGIFGHVSVRALFHFGIADLVFGVFYLHNCKVNKIVWIVYIIINKLEEINISGEGLEEEGVYELEGAVNVGFVDYESEGCG